MTNHDCVTQILPYLHGVGWAGSWIDEVGSRVSVILDNNPQLLGLSGGTFRHTCAKGLRISYALYIPQLSLEVVNIPGRGELPPTRSTAQWNDVALGWIVARKNPFYLVKSLHENSFNHPVRFIQPFHPAISMLLHQKVFSAREIKFNFSDLFSCNSTVDLCSRILTKKRITLTIKDQLVMCVHWRSACGGDLFI